MDSLGCVFRCTFDAPVELPEFKGSLLRGMLGRSLRKVSCALSRGECTDCLLSSRCVYSRAFEVPRGHSNGPTPPHPYLLEPPLSSQVNYAAGDSLEIGLTLFGDMVSNLPYFIYAFEKMGEDGLGVSREKGLSPFRLESVSTEAGPIYDNKNKRLLSGIEPAKLEVGASRPLGRYSQLVLHLLTPLRIKHKNSFARELTFQLLVRAILRRISSMFKCFDGVEPDLDYRGLVHRAQDVSTVHDTTHWKDWTRYSSRQKQAMQFGGLTGSITFSGDIGEYLPLLDVCKILHVGKQSVFGLGYIDYTIES